MKAKRLPGEVPSQRRQVGSGRWPLGLGGGPELGATTRPCTTGSSKLRKDRRDGPAVSAGSSGPSWRRAPAGSQAGRWPITSAPKARELGRGLRRPH